MSEGGISQLSPKCSCLVPEYPYTAEFAIPVCKLEATKWDKIFSYLDTEFPAPGDPKYCL